MHSLSINVQKAIVIKNWHYLQITVEETQRWSPVRICETCWRQVVVKAHFVKQGVHSLCFEFKHLVYINRAIARQIQLQRIQCTFQAWFPTGTLGDSVGSCLPPGFPGCAGRLASLFQGLLSWGYSLRNHTEWSPKQKVLSKLSLNKYCRYPHPVHMDSEVLTWCKIQSIENQWTNRGLGAMAEIFWDFNPEGKWLESLTSAQVPAQCPKTPSRSGYSPVDPSEELDKPSHFIENQQGFTSNSIWLSNSFLPTPTRSLQLSKKPKITWN